MQSLAQSVAREQAVDRRRRAQARAQAARSQHPPSRVRWRAAAAAARLAERLDADAARLILK